MIKAQKLTPEELSSTWEEFHATRSTAAHEKLALHYCDLVRRVVSWSRTAFPANLDIEDANSSGMVGLLDAIRRFDPARGFRFETFATSRIRGAVIDELRTMDWVPRGMRAKIREVSQVASAFEDEHSRPPTRAELRDLTGLSETELAERSPPAVVTMSDAMIEVEGERLDLANILADTSGTGPEASAEVTEVADLVSGALATLSTEEQLAIQTYYVQGKTLAETGRLMHVPEGRAGALHASALHRVRRTLSRGYAYADV